MAGSREAFVGIDAAKLRNAVAVADEGRDGEIRYLGEFDAAPESMRRLVARLAAKYDRLHFCYEAGPTGYGLYRLIVSLGHSCTVVAPSLIPRKPSDRVKTNRRDATGTCQRSCRAGFVTGSPILFVVGGAARGLVRLPRCSRRRGRQVGTGKQVRQSNRKAGPQWPWPPRCRAPG